MKPPGVPLPGVPPLAVRPTGGRPGGTRSPDADSEPLARTYVITQGRSGAGPRRRFDLVTLIVAVVPPDPDPGPAFGRRPDPGWGSGATPGRRAESGVGAGAATGVPSGVASGLPSGVASGLPSGLPAGASMPEHRAILELCRRPMAVAEIAAHLRLPFSAAAVLIGDLVDAGLAAERRPARAPAVDAALLREVINGLQRL